MRPRCRIWCSWRRVRTCWFLIARFLIRRTRRSQLYDLHTPPREIGQAARDSGVRKLLLSHLAPDVEGQKDTVRKSIRASFAGAVAFATDRLRLPVLHSL